MLDLKFIRENQELVKRAVDLKKENCDIDLILEIDKKKRLLQFNFDQLKAKQNNISRQIPVLKNSGKDVEGLLKEMKVLSADIKQIAAELTDCSDLLKLKLLQVPNVPNESVPVGDESQNRLVREWGQKKQFDFTPLDHLTLAEKNSLLDLSRSAKISGSGFAGYINMGAKLERAMINFMLDFHVKKHGYSEVSLPIIVNRPTMTGTGQLPKLEDDMYHIDLDDLFLIPTAEVSVTNLYSSEILSYKDLPLSHVSYSPCFRREAGSYGKDTKGLQRLHQFNKVEMVRFVKPQESYQVLETMTNDAEEILQAFGMHYRVVSLATGDLSFASAKTYDLEVWAPGTGKYLEVSSISNFEDFQARRASIRFRGEDGNLKFVHTLNGSGLATPRTFIAMIETYQEADGSIKIPDILKSYLDERRII